MDIEQIRTRDITVGLIGLGYAGLPLAVAFAEAGIEVVGVDINPSHVAQLNEGRSHTPDVSDAQLGPLVQAGIFRATTDYAHLSDADAILICVPTPLRKSHDPDISYIVHATEGLLPYLKDGALVVLQSTTYPGTTEEVLLPRLTERGGTVGKDFYLAFSPERVDPGNQHYTTRTIPRVVGGMTERCTALTVTLFEQVVEEVIAVSNPKTAEMTKLLENSFRAVNIGLANETALICERLGINVWEVIASAASKPFGFMPHYPGPGIGGHCIPVDPEYLAWKMRTLDYETRFIRLASEVNASMADHVVQLTSKALNGLRKPVNGARVLVLGVAYKAEVGDTRESPALPILMTLRDLGAEIVYHDPYAPTCELPDGTPLRSLPDLHSEDLGQADVVLILTAHRFYNWEGIVRHAPLIVDTRNATHAVRSHARGQIVCL